MYSSDPHMKTFFRLALVKVAVLILLSINFALYGQQVFGEQAPSVAERVLLVGDSTVASRSGWGDAFGEMLKPEVECINMGRGGRSSKSYRDEKHWQRTLEKMPTWVLIQFGHNDQPGKGPKRETDAKTTYRENLKRFIQEARDIGAKPVLITSLTRRNFNGQGKIVAGQLEAGTDSAGLVLLDYLNDYVVAARAVALEEKVPLLDLNARSIKQLNEMGPEQAAAYDPPAKDANRPDKTHLSAKGAEETAKLVADEIRLKVPELAALLMQ